jgi:dTDP-4-amino-4,6-dideoxygalactose transaminase
VLTLFRATANEETLVPDGGTLAVPRWSSSMCRLATGRSALFHLTGRLPDDSIRAVLLPAYVAEGVIQPFVRAKFDILFYRLQPDLRPCAEDVVELLKKTKGRVLFVLVHYFGFSARSEELSAALAMYRPVILEDFAHALFSTLPDGTPLSADAELSLFSLNKFLPVVDGAFLYSTRSDIDLFLEEEQLPELPLQARRDYSDHLRAARDFRACDDMASARSLLAGVGRTYERYYEEISTDLEPRRQSDEGQRVARLFPCGSLIRKRIANSRIFYRDLEAKSLRPVHPDLPEGVVPFCIPARVPAGNRSRILDDLLARGILLSTLQDKWNFVPAKDAARYAVETAFMEEHVLIPVSENISPESMAHMVAQLNSV